MKHEIINDKPITETIIQLKGKAANTLITYLPAGNMKCKRSKSEYTADDRFTVSFREEIRMTAAREDIDHWLKQDRELRSLIAEVPHTVKPMRWYWCSQIQNLENDQRDRWHLERSLNIRLVHDRILDS